MGLTVSRSPSSACTHTPRLFHGPDYFTVSTCCTYIDLGSRGYFGVNVALVTPQPWRPEGAFTVVASDRPTVPLPVCPYQIARPLTGARWRWVVGVERGSFGRLRVYCSSSLPETFLSRSRLKNRVDMLASIGVTTAALSLKFGNWRLVKSPYWSRSRLTSGRSTV